MRDDTHTNIAGILLAAGQSTRFGSNKLLHRLSDIQVPMAVQAAINLLDILPHSIAVVRQNDDELKSLLSATGIKLVENPHADLGMSSSIRCGIESLSQKRKGWIIALADMPYIPPIVIQQVADAIRKGALICAPQFNKQRGHPVGFSCQLKDELLNLQGDSGAKPVIDKHYRQLQLIDVSSNVVLRDIDYPTD